MNKDVEILRESIRVITQLLSESDIKVTQSGVDAYVKADSRTGKPALINLPYLPDDASEEIILAIQGYLDHEVAHALFSDFEKAPQLAISKGVKSTHNIVEDAFIEKKMAEKFRGSAYNLDKVGQFYLDKFVQKTLDEGDKDKIVGVLTVTAIRAFSGQQLFINFMKDKWHYIQDFKDKIEPLSKEIASCESSMDCVNVAVKIKEALNKSKKEDVPPPPQQKPDESSKDSSKEDDKEDSKEESNREDSDDESEEDSNEEDSNEEDSNEEDSNEEDSNEEDSNDGSDEEDSNDGSDEEDSDEESSNGDDGSDSDEGGSDDEDSDEGGSSFNIESAIDESGADTGLSDSMADEVVHSLKSAEYVIFTDEGDLVEPLPELHWGSEEEANAFENTVSHMTAPIQKDIERAIVAKSQSTWQNGKRSGRLNGSNLSRLAVGDDRIFRRREVNNSKDVAVSLVVDCSGSMCGDKMLLASQAAMTLSSVLDRLNITHELIGFTTKLMGVDNFAKISKVAREHNIKFARMNNLYMPIFKQYSESMSMQVKQKLCQLKYGSFMEANVDGESVMIAAKRLMVQREKGKIMIVLSDGMPACPGNGDLDLHLKQSVKEIESWGVNVVGIGINSTSVQNFYPKNIFVDDVDDLPAVVGKQLKGMLLRK